VDLHLFLRTYLFGLGHGRDSLESRGQPAPPDEMSRLWQIDLAGSFTKPANACWLVSVKSIGAIEQLCDEVRRSPCRHQEDGGVPTIHAAP
jgi:hypothetical protein